MSEGKYRLNPFTGQKFKRAEWNQDKTKKFWSYRAHVKKDGEFAEVWFDEEKYLTTVVSELNKQRKRNQSNSKIYKPKRVNPKTGVKFKTGDSREDGYRFVKYDPAGAVKRGFMSEVYASPRGWTNLRIGYTFYKLKKRAEENKIPMRVSKAFLISIFPEDSVCPVLGINMDFGGDSRMDSPSIDRLVPELGYVPNNVIWMCQEANLIKSDRTSSELRAIADWIERQTIYQKLN